MTVNVKRLWQYRDTLFHLSEGVILVFLVGIDQYTKYWFQSHDLVVFNPGGVFGILPSLKWMFLWILWIVLLWEWIHMRRGLARLGMGLIVAGGLGNLLDRVLFGSVRDFIAYPYVGFYGNGADILLAIGGILLVGIWLLTRNDRIAS